VVAVVVLVNTVKTMELSE